MTFNDNAFQALCFFSLGFLCLVSCVGLYLGILFKSKIYYYYCGYVVTNIIFIIAVYCKANGYVLAHSFQFNVLELLIDVVQMIGSFMFGAFIYYALLQEDEKFIKLKLVFQFYAVFTLFYVIVVVLFPYFVLECIPYFIVSRVIVVLLSFLFYYHIMLELKKIYFRYLFLAISFLLISGFLAFWDSLTNYYSDLYLGFVFMCLGYVLENTCFVCAFIYKYFFTNQQKIKAEILHQEQLNIVQIEIQRQTMEQIGREIHDNIGQKLTLASLYTQQLAYENKAPLINNCIENISSIINQSLSELRGLSKSLTDNTIKANTINQLLQRECDGFNELKKCNVIFSSNANYLELSEQSKIVLLRIAQEFIQNSIKHSDCKNINVTLIHTNNLLQLCLQDDGKGFDVKNEKGLGIGLSNIKKRIQLIGGTHKLESNENGTKLIIEISL
ncbi:hypothetical protein KBJ98_10320 [Flavobacterium sp. F-328]|jgi:signal transduction histidine kinase|uniref:histidine kinase n=1 Tax=Flavobacterium erciyesense TaxID=2825842 RepID=A0ABS5D506_9FLAO|nr:ATP-binding protein [Flavobacterium erciyesense]MBQ0909097.1 hypothetical protein [Flavobacterium erciyesense]